MKFFSRLGFYAERVNRMIAGIALDLDGTLVDSVPDLAATANRIRAQQGLRPLPMERMRQFVGDGVSALLKRALTDSLDDEPDAEQFRQALSAFHQDYAQHLADLTRPYPGVVEALSAVKQLGLPMILVSNKPERHAQALLQALQLTPFLPQLIGGDSLPQRKPAPEPLWEAARRLGLQPAQLLMVGDSDNDFWSAQAAGCPCALVQYGYGPVMHLPALAHWTDLRQMLPWLKSRPV